MGVKWSETLWVFGPFSYLPWFGGVAPVLFNRAA